MSEKRIIPKIGVLAILALLLYVSVNIFDQKGADMSENMSMILRFVNKKNNNTTLGENMLNCYMPVVGYVDSYYVDNSFLSDPSLKGEKNDAGNIDVEYINIESKINENGSGNSSGNNSENVSENGIISENVNEEKTDAVSMNESQETSLTIVPQSFAKLQKSDLTNLSTLLKDYYTVTSITELTDKKFDVPAALEQDFTIQQDATSPQILIFHTHSQEAFADSMEGDINTSIVSVGARLAQILSTQYGYNVIHDTSVYDFVDGVLDRSKAYTYAEQGVKKILDQYPTVEVVLDIHRDGVDDSVHLVTDIDGRRTARFMLFNGISYTKVNGDIQYLKNPYIQDNLAMSLQMYLLGKVYYPELLRKNFVNGYRYCLHLRAKSMLIEVGAQNNTLEEEYNAMIPLADLLNRMLTGEKAYE